LCTRSRSSGTGHVGTIPKQSTSTLGTMVEVRVSHPVAPGDVSLARALADSVEVADGHPAVGEAVWRDLAHPGPHTSLLLAYDGDEPVGALHVGAAEAGRPHTTLALVVAPQHRDRGVATELLARALDVVRDRSAEAELWVFGAGDRSDAFARD